MLRLLFVHFCFSLSAFGAIIQPIDTTNTLRCTLSGLYHNRIFVKNGRIKKIIHLEEHVAVTTENISGQAFVYAASPLINSTTLSIVTDEGDVQDIEIFFDNVPAEVVILHKDVLDVPAPHCISATELPYSTNSVIDQLLRGRHPLGYTSIPVAKMQKLIKPGICVKLLDKLVGAENSLYLFEVSNVTKRKKCVNERDLAFESSRWVFLEKNCLRPREKVIAIVAEGHD